MHQQEHSVTIVIESLAAADEGESGAISFCSGSLVRSMALRLLVKSIRNWLTDCCYLSITGLEAF